MGFSFCGWWLPRKTMNSFCFWLDQNLYMYEQFWWNLSSCGLIESVFYIIVFFFSMFCWINPNSLCFRDVFVIYRPQGEWFCWHVWWFWDAWIEAGCCYFVGNTTIWNYSEFSVSVYSLLRFFIFFLESCKDIYNFVWFEIWWILGKFINCFPLLNLIHEALAVLLIL